MVRWIIPAIALAAVLAYAQDPAKPGELQKDRQPKQTSGKQAVPPEEDKAFLKEEHSFNPLQSKNSVEIGDGYLRKGKVQAAANRYVDATLWNAGNAEAWLKLARADERLRDTSGAKTAYAKYLELVPNAKDAGEIRKKLDRLK
jgi:tetratricopeptide (TPR) repeat protein